MINEFRLRKAGFLYGIILVILDLDRVLALLIRAVVALLIAAPKADRDRRVRPEVVLVQAVVLARHLHASVPLRAALVLAADLQAALEVRLPRRMAKLAKIEAFQQYFQIYTICMFIYSFLNLSKPLMKGYISEKNSLISFVIVENV